MPTPFFSISCFSLCIRSVGSSSMVEVGDIHGNGGHLVSSCHALSKLSFSLLPFLGFPYFSYRSAFLPQCPHIDYRSCSPLYQVELLLLLLWLVLSVSLSIVDAVIWVIEEALSQFTYSCHGGHCRCSGTCLNGGRFCSSNWLVH